MALQFSTTYRNAMLDTFESTVGTAAKLQIFTAAAANCAAADSGSKLADMTLPSDWMSAAATGSKALLGTWSDSAADATGTAVQFRIKDSAGTTCHMQGTITATSGGGDMELATTAITAATAVTITSFTLSVGGA